MGEVQDMLETLNAHRVERSEKPLKSWKGSKAKLQALLAEVEHEAEYGLHEAAAPTRDLTEAERLQAEIEAKVRVIPPSAPELSQSQSRTAQLDKIVAKRMKGEDVKLPTRARKEPVAPVVKSKPVAEPRAKRTGEGVTLADIARELGLSPKVARAKMRRVSVPSEYLLAKHVYKPEHKQWVIDTLKRDHRK